MRLDPNTFWGSRLISLGALLLSWILALAGRTWRYEIVAGADHLEELLAARRPVILSFWHNRAFLISWFLLRRLHGHGLTVTVLASQSRDGELVSRLAGRLRLAVVRGSATRGGRAALRGIHRSLVRQGTSPIMIPDGPVGPIYKFKMGVLVLAQMSGAPVVPIGLAAARFRRIRSWDRLIVPRLFSRIAVAVGPPQVLPRQLAGEAQETERQRLEALLDEVTRAAETAVGAEDVARPSAG